MTAEHIVQALLEDDVADFLKSMPPSTWVTFHIARDREDGVMAGRGYRNHYLVYKNNDDLKTRDFIGYINTVGFAVHPGWITTGFYVPKWVSGQPSKTLSWYSGTRYATKKEAAQALYDKYKSYIPVRFRPTTA